MSKYRKPLFIKVQKYAVGDLLRTPDTKLLKLEQILREEARQATLSYHWLQGVIRLKKAMEDNNHE